MKAKKRGQRRNPLFAIKMACCYLTYLKANPKTRQLFNQAFFKKIYIKNKKIDSVEYTDLFDLLFTQSLNKDSVVPQRDENYSLAHHLLPWSIWCNLEQFIHGRELRMGFL
ncbi:MAG: hypothetical protein QME54_02675 [Actinomycetota bacterium]|nr:hypothetical protein [Actinomycetota bacterium]